MDDGEEIVSNFRRVNRLMALSLMLGEARLRAADAAAALGVTVRTIYRDIAALRAAGLAVQGHPGIGYWLDAQPQTAALMLTREEKRALIAGLKLVKAGEDRGLAGVAEALLGKVMAI
jgi:predicted DNA-binding transcriptional regulator YafY